MNNMYFTSGDSTRNEIIEDTRDGVLLLSGGGGLEDPEKGRFQFSVQNCYKITNVRWESHLEGALSRVGHLKQC